jgi:CheY-like chemotaxis protein
MFNPSNGKVLMKQYDNSKTPGLLTQEHRSQSLVFRGVINTSEQSLHHRRRYFSESDISGCAFGENDTDVIDFLAEETDPQELRKSAPAWKILIADDDQNVHDTTLLALTGVRIHGRPLEFLHAFTAKEAYQVLLGNPDTSLVLLDVVMETVDAGLKLVNVIRNELGNSALRIVLRTGQPGYAPEQKVSNEFVIDGYTTKSKLTRSMLISVLTDTLGDANLVDGLPN